ncbi:hypothetical protein [Abiotrophia defectiva]|uniref:hypothetical protein n=1 Tax=Abiotrophia defectiva TaxID=46125 RepID=UPI0028D81E92|nr:hypothetical protein [Abiotrophia defectiva]
MKNIKLSKKELLIYRALGVTGKKVNRYTVIRLNNLLGVSLNKFDKEGNYFHLYCDNLKTLISLTNRDSKLTPMIKSEENSTTYSSTGEPSVGGKEQEGIRRTIRWGLLVSHGCKLSSPPYYKRTVSKKDIVSGSKSKKSNGQFTCIHRGHMLGKSILKRVGIKDGFVEKSNMNNIYAQAERANLHSHNNYGQKYFEDLVISYINKLGKKQYLYYEVEAIFSSKNDRVPIGTKLRCIEIDLNREEHVERFFVFIPNYQEKYSIDYRNGF